MVGADEASNRPGSCKMAKIWVSKHATEGVHTAMLWRQLRELHGARKRRSNVPWFPKRHQVSAIKST